MGKSLYDAIQVRDGEKSIKVMVSKNCPHCHELERALKKEIESGKIKLVNSDSPEGDALAKKLNIRSIPTFIGIITHNDGKITTCRLGKEMEIEECVED